MNAALDVWKADRLFKHNLLTAMQLTCRCILVSDPEQFGFVAHGLESTTT